MTKRASMKQRRINTKQGQNLWLRAKASIPGGNQLLSKRPEIFLPDQWPPYYSSAKGCEVWDVDGNKYYDFATMGVGSCALGFSDEFVNSKVIDAINNGSMASLNSVEEVLLAEKLIDLHPWAGAARFAKTGGEACMIAARIARAKTGRSKIAFCGYHGWHDWYLAANIKDENNLNQQLLSGLEPKGVPSELINTALPFLYNDINSFLSVAVQNRDELAAVFMEPVRNQEPTDDFLRTIREFTDDNNIVLIFDEITSGFRLNVGGAHLNYGVTPDIAVLGKALGNGFPIAAVIGKDNIMSYAQDSFISSTMWTERTGYVAALATIEKMQKQNVQEYLIQYGKIIKKIWSDEAEQLGLKIKTSGIPPLAHIDFDYEASAIIQTIYTQEMLKYGFLTGSNVYTTFAYNENILNDYKNAVSSVFSKLVEIIQTDSLEASLEGPKKHTGFQRLN